LSTLFAALLVRAALAPFELPTRADVFISSTLRLIVVLSIVWGLYRLVDVVGNGLHRRALQTETKLDDQLIPLLRKLGKVVVVVSGLVFALQNVNVDVGSLLTGLGLGGLAIALAAKETLANFFGSLMIFIDRPFQVGDWIKVKGVEGIVEEIGFRSTRIRTFYNSVTIVPNATFTDAQIDNYGLREYRRTHVTLTITYDTSPERMQAFCEGIRAIILANEFTRKDNYEVHMSGFGASALEIILYFFFKLPSWTEELRERHRIYLEIMRLAQELEIKFAFPTQTLLVDKLPIAGEVAEISPTPPRETLARVVRGFGPNGDLSRPGGPTIVPGAMEAGAQPSDPEAQRN
jgi:MscS family membrane protein